MYGTSFEHSLLYQYNLHGARNVLMALIQTETPYFQPSPHTPFLTSPSAVLAEHATDPQFCTNDPRCDMSMALVVQVRCAFLACCALTYWDCRRPQARMCISTGAGCTRFSTCGIRLVCTAATAATTVATTATSLQSASSRSPVSPLIQRYSGSPISYNVD